MTEWFLQCVEDESETSRNNKHFDSKRFMTRCHNQINHLMQNHLQSEYVPFINGLGGWADFDDYIYYQNYKPGILSTFTVYVLTILTGVFIMIRD